MPKVIFVLPSGEKREVSYQAGATLLQVAKANGIDQIEGACGGAMACSTCHVIVGEGWYAKLPKPTDDETDMLDLAPGITRTSRLGCQIDMTEALDGLSVTVPASTKSLL